MDKTSAADFSARESRYSTNHATKYTSLSSPPLTSVISLWLPPELPHNSIHLEKAKDNLSWCEYILVYVDSLWGLVSARTREVVTARGLP